MRKVFGLTVVVICMAIYYISSDEDLTNRIIQMKLEATSSFGSDRFRYGDLYGMSNLRKFRNQIHARHFDTASCNVPARANLFAICDSYIWSFFDSGKYFCGIDSLTYSRVNFRETFRSRPDTSKTNIFLIALAERNIREILYDSAYLEKVLAFNSENSSSNHAPASGPPAKKSWKDILRDTRIQVNRRLFSKQINTNLQSNLWEYSFLHGIKEAKADINHALFKSTDNDVTLGNAGDQLFYAQTIDTSYEKMSSFNTVSDEEIILLVKKFNLLQMKAKLAGYDKIFLTLIPNPVSIIEPGHSGLRYNRLVERIQRNPELTCEFIDLLPVFAQLKNKAYYASDTHWNSVGASAWLKFFNEKLSGYYQRKNFQ